ncbi:hypothetical protein BKI52_30125 [marine bacterium AO1-C]|nr:hypothetical protein BKI52_30125 [marine bacterium AO1-C]
MTFYEEEVKRIRQSIYSNQGQLDIIMAVRIYINNHYDNADLNLDLLSQIHCISKYHLLRLFKKYYGLTPRQYLMDKRIEKSKECLKNRMSVTETCFAVGFQSLGSFSTLFKTKTGKSPVQFQKSNFQEAS